MEINYFDLPGDFTLNFFPPLWETTGPSFSNHALAKKKKKKIILFFQPQKWVQVWTQYTGRTNR